MSARELITDHLDLWTGAVTQKRSGGRGNNGKIELTGIKKLRELILELAVRGKLVEQDPSDEPASVLLERIAQEKARLVKEGKIRKPRKLPPLSDTSKPFPLPERWEWTQIEAVGHDWGQKEPDKAFSYIDVSAIDNIKGVIKKPETISPINAPSRARKKVRPNTVIYSTVRPYLQNIAVVEDQVDPEPIASTAFAIVSPLCGVPARYLLHYLRSPVFVRYVESVQTGIAYPAINDKQFFSGALPVPPLKEQHRIVEKVDELMALCDRLEQQVGDQLEAHEVLVDTLLDALTCSADAAEVAENWARLAEHFDTLFTTEASIDKLKQAILQLAVMGRLVEQDPNDEPASVLLEKIAEEKTRLIKERKIKKSKVTPKMQEETIPFDIPKNWEWCRLESLTLYSESGWSPQCNSAPRSEDGWGVLKVSAVSWGKFNPNENKGLPDSLSPRKELEVRPSDFLISRANTADLVARSVIVPTTSPEKLMLSDKIIRVVLSKKIYPPYINIFNNSAYAREYYSSVAGGTSHSMKNVSRDKINQLAIALPPLNEQIRILEVVENLLLLCEKINKSLHCLAGLKVELANGAVRKASGDR